MKINSIYNQCKDVFIKPKKRFYFGKLAFGAPYFYPINFNENIITFHKLNLKPEEEYDKFVKNYPHLKNNKSSKFTNLPMVRRTRDKIIKLFGNYYFIAIGYPLAIKWYELGWKDKFASPRYEWSPSFQIYFFKWQFCIWWGNDKNVDQYYEMMLWYVIYCKKDLTLAKNSWPWVDLETNKSTWNDEFIHKK